MVSDVTRVRIALVATALVDRRRTSGEFLVAARSSWFRRVASGPIGAPGCT